MPTISVIVVIIALLGLILYFVPVSNAKINEVGRIVFQVAFFFLVWSLAGHSFR
jgi:uncharacterized membrane protein YiaA